MEGIQIGVERAEANLEISIVKIKGYIDTTTSSELERVIQNLLREQRYKIIVDLSQVDYISSAGWGIFISEIKNLRSHRGDLKLASMSENVNEVYELLEFSTILSAAPNVVEAIRRFDGGANAGLELSAAAKKIPAARPIAATPPAMSTVSIAPTETVHPEISTAPEVPVVRFQPSAPKEASAGTLVERIQAVVRQHPEWGAWKIKGEINHRRGNFPPVGWFEVRTGLKSAGLKSKAERVKFARSR